MSIEEWRACGSRSVDVGQPAAPGGVHNETAVADGGLSTRKIGS